MLEILAWLGIVWGALVLLFIVVGMSFLIIVTVKMMLETLFE